MSHYRKSLAALAAGLATAAALLPTDAPLWLLALGVIVQTAAVWASPANKPPRRSTGRVDSW